MVLGGMLARMRQKATEKAAMREMEGMAKRINAKGGARAYIGAYLAYARDPARWNTIELGNYHDDSSDYPKHEVQLAAITALHSLRAARVPDEGVDEGYWLRQLHDAYVISASHLNLEDGKLLTAFIGQAIDEGSKEDYDLFGAMRKARIHRTSKAEEAWARFVAHEEPVPNPMGIRF